MRKSTLLWLVLAAICSALLFRTSQKVHDEHEKLDELTVSITKEEESLRVLKTEWGYLNQPARLEKLAKAYLHTAPLKGSQFIKIENVPPRPAAAAGPVASAPDTDKKEVETKAPAKQESAKKAVAAAEAQKPVVKIRKSVAPTLLATKPAHPHAEADTAASARDFDDVMKSLHTGVE